MSILFRTLFCGKKILPQATELLKWRWLKINLKKKNDNFWKTHRVYFCGNAFKCDGNLDERVFRPINSDKRRHNEATLHHHPKVLLEMRFISCFCVNLIAIIILISSLRRMGRWIAFFRWNYVSVRKSSKPNCHQAFQKVRHLGSWQIAKICP